MVLLIVASYIIYASLRKYLSAQQHMIKQDNIIGACQRSWTCQLEHIPAHTQNKQYQQEQQ